MRFRRSAIPVECELDWIEPTIDAMYECLKSPEPPKQDHYAFKGKERNKCDQCAYLNMYQDLNIEKTFTFKSYKIEFWVKKITVSFDMTF